jgi:DNA-binding Lrp family transcriptional regulator
MIDSTDRKIIKALTLDARLSNVQLAQQLNIAVSTVSRRIDALLRDKVISIKALPNPFKIGYKASAVIGLDVDLNQVDDVCAKLSGNSHMTLVVTTFGRFDVLIIADYENFELLNHFIKQELPQIQGVKAAEPFFVTETAKRYSGMFQNNSSANSIEIDETNRKLFEILGKNGRVAYSELADELGISIATVSRRIAHLVKKEIIKITAVPNPAKFGFLAIGCVMLHVDFSKIDNIAARLAEKTEVHVVMKLTNSFDIFFIVHFPYPEQLYQYLKMEIARIDGVLNMETFIISEIIKLSTTVTGLKID